MEIPRLLASFRIKNFNNYCDQKILPSSSKFPWWVLIYLGLSTMFIYVVFSHWAYDDPFITYRYAYNLAHGLGFVYNPSERILSTTTPLFTLLLVPFSLLNFDLSRVAVFFGAISISSGGLLLWYLASSWKPALVGWAGIALYTTFPLLYATLGSETPIYITFCLGSFMFYARQRYNWTAVFCSLATLTRPDGILVPLILAIDFLLRDRQSIPWKPVLLFLGLTLPWFIFAWLYFGSPIPVTLIAKQHQGGMSISLPFARGFLYWARGYAQQWFYWVEATLAFLGFVYLLWREHQWMPLISWTICYFIAYSILGVSRYHWYYAPLLPGYVILVGIGGYAISANLSFVRKLSLVDNHSGDIVLTVSVIAAILVFSIGQGSSLLKLRNLPDKRVSIYKDIGTWLTENTPPNALVGALEVGIIGYYSHRPMLDFAGLIQPDIAQQLKFNTTYDDVALWAVENKRPDYLVLHSGGFPKVEQSYVAQYCHLVKRFPKEPYGYSSDMDMYACK